MRTSFLYPKKLIFLILLTLILHGRVIFNGFAGDDAILFLNNNFYRSFSNIGMLFSRDYITRPDIVFKNESDNKGSGSVAYRPVLSLTYFLDTQCWGAVPWGYHFTNLLLHLLNTVLIFLLLSEFFLSGRAAFVAALLFSVHPVQSEAVAAIGFRADLLVVFFSLVSVGCWCLFRRYGTCVWASGAVFVFFLAIFSKEAAFFLPLIFFLYDRVYVQSFQRRTELVWFLMCGAVMAVYLYCYTVVFQNQTVLDIWGGWSLLKHAGLITAALGINLKMFLFPTDLISFPGLYLPSILSPATSEFWGLLFLMTGCLLWVARGIIIRDRTVFWACWFLLTYFPVSNLIPSWNPIALRFMYMPGIAVWILCGVLYDKAFQRNVPILKVMARWGMVLFVGLCAIATLNNEFLWKDNMTIGRAWIARYPKSYKGYEICAEEALKTGKNNDAIYYDEMAIALSPSLNNPSSTAVIEIVSAYLAKNDIMSAELYLDTYPAIDKYAAGMFLRGHIYELKGDVAAAIKAYASAVQISPTPEYGEDLIRLSLKFSDYAAARWALEQELSRSDSPERKKLWQNTYGLYFNEYIYDDIQEVCWH